MKKIFSARKTGVWMILLSALLTSCSAQPQVEQSVPEVLPVIDTAVLPQETGLEETVEPTQLETVISRVETLSVVLETFEDVEYANLYEAYPLVIQQRPARSTLSPELFEGVTVGGPDDAFICDYEYPADWPQPEGEIILTLSYDIPLRPDVVTIQVGEKLNGIRRVELLSSNSGLGILAFETGQLNNRQKAEDGDCIENIVLPVESDFDVDTIIISFNSMPDVFQLSTVEMVGHVHLYSEIPVFWRVPVPHDSLADSDSRFPGGMATDAWNTVFLANGQNGLQRFDVEGNLMQDYSVPSASYLSDVAIDSRQYIVVTDSVYGWFVLLNQAGLQLVTGGEDFAWNNPKTIAINPLDDQLFLLNTVDQMSQIRVYTNDTAQWVRDISLEATGEFGYKGLAFDKQGYLYTFSVSEGMIIKIDPWNGEQVDALGYDVLGRSSVSDLDIDDQGNFYVLMSTSPENVAVAILDPEGSLIRRLGLLNYDGSNREEGVFLFPVSLAVTSDGQFLFIRENEFLTAYWLEL